MTSLIVLKLKTTPILIYLPFISIILFTVLILTIDMNINLILISLQLLYTLISILWSLFLFYDLFSSEKYEYLKDIYIPWLGRLLLSFFILLTFLLMLNILIISSIFESISFFSTFSLILSQIFVSSTIVLILFALCGNVTFPLTVSFLYFSAELATFGQSKYLYHLWALDFIFDYSFEGLLNIIILNLVFGFSCYLVFRFILTQKHISDLFKKS